MKVVLMSIKPRYSRLIFAGVKRFELRRSRSRLDEGDVVVVYASSPVKAIVGAFLVRGTTRREVERMWEDHGRHLGVSLDEYNEYFDGTCEVFAIEVGPRVEVDPIPLDRLREKFDGFRPPQSFMYWRRRLEELLGSTASRQIAAEAQAMA